MSIQSSWRPSPIPEMQADVTLTQANPVSGTLYTVLSTTRNARIYGACARATWDVQPNPLQLHFTVDGNALSHNYTNPVTATWYYPSNYPAAAETAQGMSSTAQPNQDGSFLHEGRSVKVEAETTGGTVTELASRVKYAKW